MYLTFVDNTSGNRPAEIDSNLKYNPSTGILSSGSFKGNLTGNASGSSGSCTGNSATSTLATTVTITDNENTDEDNAIIFAAGGNVDGGNLGLESDGNLTYNPSTGRISATGFLGTVFTPTQGTIDHDSLANFVANEHIDHSSVSVIAGTGLTGGGTIAVDRTLNVGGGDGITANANDIAITPDQTTITSIYNAGLKIGRDSQNLIDFATTDNKINFRVNDVNDFVMTANSFSPVTSDGAALGSAANMWSDLFLASDSFINFNNGDVTVTHSSNKLTVAGGNLEATISTATQGTIDHDSLANFVANEHIDHSSVSVIAGTGLTGGGTIAVDRTLNVGGGDGITANANDIAITPDQTTITSIYNAGLKIGRDSQNLIDFATTDNKINFRVNDVNDFVMTANSFSPDTSDGAALGSAANMWSDLFLASGSTINFNNGDVTVTHSSNTLTVAGGNLAATISTATQGTIDHDSLANFVANEHIDHSSVSVIAGTGLTGGGTIAVDRTITLNADGTTLSNNVGSGQAGVLKVPNALTAGTNISFNNSGASYDGSTPLVISVDDAFVKNSSDDTMVGTLTLSKISTSNNVLTALILQNSNLISSGGIGLGVDMLFKIENSSGSMETTGGIRSTMIDPTNNTEDACLYFSTMSAGSYSTYLTLDGSTSRINIGDTVNGIYLTKSTGSLINFGNNISLKHSSNTLEMTGASSGGFTCDGDITAFKTSDRRFKDNIVKIENPIEKIKKIGGYNFEWNKLGEKNTINKGKDVGLIAQEIEEVIPEATTIRSNGYKAVQYEKVVPLLIECIKDQQKMIEILQGQVNELKNKII